ncbi:MAG TPA: hypothetical protein DC054_03290 [Blastocatellia bacterium]|nr:hypothetical protein [Blastocatellia bacterium]
MRRLDGALDRQVSEPRAIARGDQNSSLNLDPVATAPGSDTKKALQTSRQIGLDPWEPLE